MAEIKDIRMKNPPKPPQRKKTGGPAFPSNNIHHQDGSIVLGMTLRDYFASKAMGRMITHDTIQWCQAHDQDVFEVIAKESYKYADAMLKEREKNV